MLWCGVARAAEYRVIPPPLPPDTGPLEAQGAAWVAAWTKEFHDPPGRYDAAALARAALEGAQPNEPRTAYFERLMQGIGDAFYAFAPADAKHDDTARYRLPFPLELPRMCTQGVNGGLTHKGDDAYAFDFAMPSGSPVVAARAGTVARVRDGFQAGGLDSKYAMKSNDVLVLHDDGTFGVYVHLQAGIPVREGQRVAAGDPIGSSGNTGLTAAPHLHFSVYVRRPGGVVSVPIRFGVGSPQGFVPQTNQFYGGKPRQTVQLVLSAGGAPLTEQSPLRLAKLEKAQLSVSLAAPGVPPVDVTRAAATRYFVPTNWSIVVDAAGLVTAEPTPDYAKAIASLAPEDRVKMTTDLGVVVVTYEDAAKNHYGFASAPVLVGNAAPP